MKFVQKKKKKYVLVCPDFEKKRFSRYCKKQDECQEAKGVYDWYVWWPKCDGKEYE